MLGDGYLIDAAFSSGLAVALEKLERGRRRAGLMGPGVEMVIQHVADSRRSAEFAFEDLASGAAREGLEDINALG